MTPQTAAFTNDFTIDAIGTNLTDQMLGLCANNCFAGSTSYRTVPYYSLDQVRTISLVYTEERAHPRPVIPADVTPIQGTPTQYLLSATLNGTKLTFLTGDTVVYFSGSSAAVRLASQFDASAYTTGLYSLVVTVTATYSGSANVTHTYSRSLVIVNEAHSPLGRGWTYGGVQRLYFTAGAYLITDGTGSAVPFAALGTQAADYSTLTYNATTHYYTRTYLDGRTVQFTATGLDTLDTDRLGHTTKYFYDSNSRLWWVYDPMRTSNRGAAPYTQITYGIDSVKIQEESTIGNLRRTNVVLGSDSTLQKITDPGGDSTTFTYDASKRLSTVTDRRGGVTTYNYDVHSWKLTELDLPQIAADAGGGSTTNVNPKLKYTPWQTLGVPTAATTSGTPATPIATSAVHATLTDPIGRVTTMTVDRWGQPLVVTDPASNVTTITRWGMLPVKIVYPTTGVDTMDYVSGTPLVSYLQTAGDSVVNYRYGAQNQIDSIWGPGLRSEYRFLDATTGRTDSIRYASSNSLKARYTYDAFNRVVSVTDPGGHTTSYGYDVNSGNVDSVATAGNLYSIKRFDLFGRDTADRATGAQVWTRTVYDSLNRVQKVWHAGITNDTTLVTYDSLFPIRVQTAGGQIYRTVRNALGWVTTRYDTYDTTKSMSFRYDTAGRVTSWTNRRGNRIDQTYDALDRLLTRTINGTLADTFSYSTDGRIMRGTRKNVSRDSLFTNLNGQVDSIVRGIAGHRYSMRYTYTPTTAGVRWTVNDTSDAGILFSNETDVLHDTLAAVDSLTLTGGHGAGTSTVRRNGDGLDTLLQIAQLGIPLRTTSTAQHQIDFRDFASYSAPTLRDSLMLDLTYDSLGRAIADHRWGINGRIRGHSFVYDSLGRFLLMRSTLDSACTDPEDVLAKGYVYTCTTHLSSVTQDSATYDAAGNRLFPNATYSATGNRLTAGPSGVSYTYDADGNLVSRTHGGVIDSLFWGWTGQLDSVASGGSSGLRHMYEYNSFGQLVRRQTKVGAGAYSVDRYFLWEGQQLLAELSYPGTARIAQYVYQGTDQPFAIVTDSSGTSLVRYIYQEPTEGNLTAVLRDSLTLRQYTQYDAWGQQLARPINQLADTNRLGWKGLMYEGDSTKLYYVRNRWYDPAVGRFVSEDPMGIVGGTNLYTFANNDPINGSDPLGLCAGGSVIGGIEDAGNGDWGCVLEDGVEDAINTVIDDVLGGLFHHHKKHKSRKGGSPKPPSGQQPKEGFKTGVCKALQSWSVPGGVYKGVSASYFIFYGGAGGVGVMTDNQGPGVYLRGGVGIGLQGSSGWETGVVAGDMQGVAVEGEAVIDGRTTNASVSLGGGTMARTASGTAAGEEPIMGHAAVTNTWTWHVADLCK